MSRADKKRRHEAKRKAKRVQIKRQQSISPFKRLVDAPGEIEYWMSQTLGAVGQVQIFVYKRAAGLTGIACFLVDFGVVGLKDAWSRTHIPRDEFDDMLDSCGRRGIPMSEAEPEDVRRIVAGGIRWAHENGMRLPKDWTRPASMIGGVGDWASADVSEFVPEFAGHPEDLRQRLIGEPFESYIRRPDIRFIFSDAAPVMDPRTGKYLEPKSWEFVEDEDADEDDLDSLDEEESPIEEIEALSERFTPTAIGLASETATWLSAHNDTPSPGLTQAWRSILLATLISAAAAPDGPDGDPRDLGLEMLKAFANGVDDDHFPEYKLGVTQALKHLRTEANLMKHAVERYGLAAESDVGS